ncbi:MAG: NAD(P)H-hydrate dehydratase [Ruminococcus sp.]|nr:NAD(P)H-hydrate dehydratase [Ruminococcus sp.]
MITDISFVKANLPCISADANKYTKGCATIFAGSYGMAGAAVLCAKAALRSGVGIVRLVVPESIYPICASSLPEAVFSVYNEAEHTLDKANLSRNSAVLIGCGMGQSKTTEDILLQLLRENTKPLLIDADGINVLSSHIDVLKKKSCPVVLTPHEGEMARLTGFTSQYIKSNREKVAAEFAKEYGVTLLLKGKNTIIASETGEVMINPTGSCALATAGSGDVLSGIITALLSQGAQPFRAAVMGAFIHGLGGDFAEKELTHRCVIASDIIEYLPSVFKEC